MDAIVAVGLTKRFGDIRAVEKADIRVGRGEFFGLLGPNGAGKTTTIRMMTGVMRPDAGRAVIEGFDMQKNPLEAKQKIGVIPEVGNVYMDLTARGNLELFARYYGVARNEREERAERMLKDLGLTERGDDLVKGFSKGMRQRISIGCAMIHEPVVLFLDEPTEGLDVMSRRMIVERIKEQSRKGTTVILTTHNIEEASKLCERVCIINKGRVVTTDTPENLKSAFEKVQSVEVCFDRKVDVGILATAVACEVEDCGDKCRLYTSDPDRLIEKIVEFKRREDVRIVSLAVVGPSLEDVFVKLTEVAR